MEYEIFPVHCGTVAGVQHANQTLKRHMGETLDLPSFLWVVRAPDRVLVVDSGPGDPESVFAITGTTLHQEEAPATAMRRLGVTPESVEDVVLTHLHYDHSGGLGMFPNARIHVQRSELQWAISPLQVHGRNYEWGITEHVPRWLLETPRMTVHSGDHQLFKGIKLIHLPGHSPGSMGVLVDTSDGQYLIAGDTVPLQENLDESVPTGWYVDLEVTYESLRRVREVADCVLPSHEPTMLGHSVFPNDHWRWSAAISRKYVP